MAGANGISVELLPWCIEFQTGIRNSGTFRKMGKGVGEISLDLMCFVCIFFCSREICRLLFVSKMNQT